MSLEDNVADFEPTSPTRYHHKGTWWLRRDMIPPVMLKCVTCGHSFGLIVPHISPYGVVMVSKDLTADPLEVFCPNCGWHSGVRLLRFTAPIQ